MTIYTFASFILYCFVTTVTPGPNNIMLMSSGVNFGFKRTLAHIFGIGFGFGLMVAVVGLGIGQLLFSSKYLYETIKIIGIIYLIYLSYQILMADSSVNTVDSKASKPLTFIQAAIFQWVNPKAWIMTMGAVTAYTAPNSSLLFFIFIGAIYGIVGIPSCGVWAYIGDQLQALLNNKTKMKKFNLVMALLLLLSIVSPLYETVIFIKSLMI